MLNEHNWQFSDLNECFHPCTTSTYKLWFYTQGLGSLRFSRLNDRLQFHKVSVLNQYEYTGKVKWQKYCTYIVLFQSFWPFKAFTLMSHSRFHKHIQTALFLHIAAHLQAHTFIKQWHTQQGQFGVQYLAQGHLDIWTREVRIKPPRFQLVGDPSEPQPTQWHFNPNPSLIKA